MKGCLKKVNVVVGQFSVNILMKGVVDGFVWTCTGVFGTKAYFNPMYMPLNGIIPLPHYSH